MIGFKADETPGVTPPGRGPKGGAAAAHEDSERINSEVWRSSKVLEIFAGREGALDPGEARLLAGIVAYAEGQPILDIGVGGGRTIPLLAPHSAGYVAVDYLPEMVELARAGHPGVRIEQADARDLSAFSDASFAAVLFSYNGIDGVGHEDREAVLREVWRVLRPGGLYAYSTHNLDYCCAGRPPWDRAQWDLGNGPRAALVYAARLPRRSRSYMKLRKLTRRGRGWAVLVGSGYDFSVLWHHLTPRAVLAELERAGYAGGTEIYDSNGALVDALGDTADLPWLYVLARKPA
jgi:SAM-dependent methyltransferase